jgi:hypothetical protein
MSSSSQAPVYVFKTDFKEAAAGTRLFLQDGLYYYKTITEQDRWLSIEEVENGKDKFELLKDKAMSILFETGKGADFSNDGKYRYRLWRIWDSGKPKAMCIGLNPSTANDEKNDNTINILIRVLTHLGFGGFYMMNCWAFITSKPELLQHNPMSDEWNNNMLTVTASKCAEVIFCWGSFAVIAEKGRDRDLIEMFPNAKCFGHNANGSPYHPRALSYKGILNNPQLIIFKI